MYGTITTLVPLYLVFQDFPIDPNLLSSRWISSMHGTSVLLTHFFDSKHMDVNDSATLMFVSFCIIKSKDWSIDMAERTWLNEPYHDTLYNGLLVGPTKMVTGAFKLAQWKTIIIHSLHAWVACQLSYARGGLLCEEQGIHECTWYQILACNLILETENLLIKILTKEVTEYLEKYDYLDAVFLEPIHK